MDYEKFKEEYDSFDKWMEESRKNYVEDVSPGPFHLHSQFVGKADVIELNRDDRVNHPSHYTRGSQEAIVTIEEAIEEAPSVKTGMLQAQVLKYLLRLWHKDNPAEDAQKARWYLDRLIDSL